MRILLVSHRYPPFGLAGVERLSEQTARDLSAVGHDVTVFTRRMSEAPPEPSLQRLERRGIPVIAAAGGGPLLGRFPGHTDRMGRLFERTLLEVMPDVVLISHLMGHSPAYVGIAHRWGIPVVLETHDFFVACERAHLERRSGDLCAGPEAGRACAAHCFPEQSHAAERWALRTHLYRGAVQQADAVVCPSQFVASYLRQTFGDAVRPRVIGNGVDAVGAGGGASPGPGLRLAYVGAIVEHKGVHVLIDALRRAALPQVELTLFGTAVQPYLNELAANAAGISGLSLHTFGSFEPTELPLLLSGIDSLVVPSLVWETYSIVSREALACGVPVLASRLGALPEAIRDGENGLLFTAGAADELALLLHRLYADPGLRASLRAGIRRDDWITVRDRTGALEQIIREIGAIEASPVQATSMQELRPVLDRLSVQPPA